MTTGSGPAGLFRRNPALLILAVFLVVLIVVVVIVVNAIKGIIGPAKDYSGDGYGTVTVHIEAGETQTEIAQTLLDDGVVGSVDAFTSAAASNSRASDIQPGYYRLRMHMSANSAVSLLLAPASLVQQSVVIPEGFTAKDIVATIAKDTNITTAALNDAIADPSTIGLPPFCQGHVEGFLFPATYDFPPGTTATQALRAMVARWKQESSMLHLPSAAHKVGLTTYQAVTLASIVQKEAVLTPDFAKIAEVFFNRMHANMPLGSNATLYYVLGPNHGPLTESDLNSSSPYNTEHTPGLPPTPIDSPGQVALEAVLHPKPGPWLYFVTINKNGHTGYATTYTQFQHLEAEAAAHGLS